LVSSVPIATNPPFIPTNFPVSLVSTNLPFILVELSDPVLEVLSLPEVFLESDPLVSTLSIPEETGVLLFLFSASNCFCAAVAAAIAAVLASS